MALLLVVELFVLTALVGCGWGPEGYRTLAQLRKRRRRGRPGEVGPVPAFVVPEQRPTSRDPRA